MKKQVEIALCMSAAVIVLVVLSNLPAERHPHYGDALRRIRGGRRSRRRLAGKDVV